MNIPDSSKFVRLPVITLCGSVKYVEEAVRADNALSKAGWCVIPYTLPLTLLGEAEELTDEEKQLYDDIHDKKIRMSQAIYVINVDGYIGKSTRREIEFAKTLGKDIYYLEESNN